MSQKFLIERITTAKVKRLMLDFRFKSLPELKISEFDDADYFLLENGNLLVIYAKDDFGIIYDSVEELKRYDNYAKGDKRLEILQTLPPDINVFFSSEMKYRKLLSDTFLLKKEQFDYSFDSLKLLDSKLYIISDFNQFMSDYYLALINYLGQVLIREKNGAWIKTFNSDYDLYEPEIELPSKKIIPLSFDLYDKASEDFANFTLFGTAIMRLDSL